MATNADWQLEIRATLTGTGTDWITDRSRGRTVSGLGVPPPKANDVDKDGQHGAYGGGDFMTSRVLTWPYACDIDDFPALCELWTPVEDAGDITITIQVPGWGVRHLIGRPRGLGDDYSEGTFGRVHGLARFDALEPRLLSAVSRNVTNKALTSNVATLTTSGAHGFEPGRSVTVAGVDATFDGTYTILSTPTTTTFTYAKTAANVGSTADTGTAASLV